VIAQLFTLRTFRHATGSPDVKSGVFSAKLGNSDQLKAIKRLARLYEV